MDLEQLLLTKLAEECQEVAKVAIKATHFGINTDVPDTNTSNRTLLTMEVMDFEATVQLCRERGLIDEDTYADNSRRINKQSRIGYYAKVSKREGRSQFTEEEMEFIWAITARES